MLEPKREALRGQIFTTDDEVKDAMRTWLQSVIKFRRRWDPSACEPPHSMHCEKGVIMLINSVALVRERTIPTERPPPVGQVSANVCG